MPRWISLGVCCGENKFHALKEGVYLVCFLTRMNNISLCNDQYKAGQPADCPYVDTAIFLGTINMVNVTL